MNRTALFFVGIILAAVGILSPPMALVAGLIFGLTVVHPLARESQAVAKFLLQASVVFLGFGMNLGEVIHVGREGLCSQPAALRLHLHLGSDLGS